METDANLASTIIAFVLNNLEGLLATSGFFAWVSTILKNGSTNPILDFVLKAINIIAGNIGKSANDPGIE